MKSVPLASIVIEEVFRFQSITAIMTMTLVFTVFDHFGFTNPFHTLSDTIFVIGEIPFGFLALKYDVSIIAYDSWLRFIA